MRCLFVLHYNDRLFVGGSGPSSVSVPYKTLSVGHQYFYFCDYRLGSAIRKAESNGVLSVLNQFADICTTVISQCCRGNFFAVQQAYRITFWSIAYPCLLYAGKWMYCKIPFYFFFFSGRTNPLTVSHWANGCLKVVGGLTEELLHKPTVAIHLDFGIGIIVYQCNAFFIINQGWGGECNKLFASDCSFP